MAQGDGGGFVVLDNSSKVYTLSRHITRNGMKNDIEKYIKYYNHTRMHTTLNDMSPMSMKV